MGEENFEDSFRPIQPITSKSYKTKAYVFPTPLRQNKQALMNQVTSIIIILIAP